MAHVMKVQPSGIIIHKYTSISHVTPAGVLKYCSIIRHYKQSHAVIRKQLFSRKVNNECFHTYIRACSMLWVPQSKIAHSMDNEKTDPGKGTQPHSHANKDSEVKFKSGPYYNSILNS